MSFRSLLAISVVFLAFVSCEKIIVLEVEDAEPIIVVEGICRDGLGENYVFLSWSSRLYENNEFKKISDAIIVVTDESGNQFSFEEDATIPGKYSSDSLEVFPSSVYDVSIIAEGKTITGTTKTQSKPVIDSLTYLSYSLTGNSSDTEYLISYHAVDAPGEQNNYWARIWIGGEEPNIYYLGNDDFIDGQYYEAIFFGVRAGQGDTVLVELMSMDENIYRYYYQLSNNADQSQFSAAPSNPEGSLEGDAIGFFGAFTTDSVMIVMP